MQNYSTTISVWPPFLACGPDRAKETTSSSSKDLALAVETLPQRVKFAAKLGDPCGSETKTLSHPFGGVPQRHLVGDLAVARRQGLKPAWEIAAKADLIGHGRAPVIYEGIRPSGIVSMRKAAEPAIQASPRRSREHVAATTPTANAAAIQDMLGGPRRQHRRKLMGIFASPDEADEALESGGHGFRDSFLAVYRRQISENNIGVTFDD
jgi:hypothetical protein